MPAEELRRNRRMGEETMRITVVGAIVIVAAVIAAILLFRALNEKKNEGRQPNSGPASPPRA
jgi:hypothetical protein